MYIPSHFKNEDQEAIHKFVREHSFGLLLTVANGEIQDTHTPFVLTEEKGLLLGHIARANSHWRSWDEDTTAKVIFTGPHAYVSPGNYESEFNVPTWNYTAVSITGKLSVIKDEEQVLDFLDELVAQNELSDSAWKLDREDERYRKLVSGIVAFSITMDQVEASFKLNQNKQPADQKSVIQSLESTDCPFERNVTSMMKQNLDQET